LRVVSLSSSPKYAALSYTWGGDPSPAYIVECGSDRIQVTKSCIDALLQISARGDKMSIWVDAISIDQKNEKEKNHQVGIMNEIYSHAKTVYVWLGSSTEDSDKAI
ncbi:heterokaryon incompatibility, partial [Trematosphaeria pertusa]